MIPSIREIVDEIAGKPPKWDTTVQAPDEARRMRAYVRFAERNNGGPIHGMCKTCAFRPGTEANSSARVLEMIEQQMLLGGRFMCHAGATVDEFSGCIPDNDGSRLRCRGFEALKSGVNPYGATSSLSPDPVSRDTV